MEKIRTVLKHQYEHDKYLNIIQQLKTERSQQESCQSLTKMLHD